MDGTAWTIGTKAAITCSAALSFATSFTAVSAEVKRILSCLRGSKRALFFII